jgi:hypothetical protein
MGVHGRPHCYHRRAGQTVRTDFVAGGLLGFCWKGMLGISVGLTVSCMDYFAKLPIWKWTWVWFFSVALCCAVVLSCGCVVLSCWRVVVLCWRVVLLSCWRVVVLWCFCVGLCSQVHVGLCASGEPALILCTARKCVPAPSHAAPRALHYRSTRLGLGQHRCMYAPTAVMCRWAHITIPGWSRCTLTVGRRLSDSQKLPCESLQR